MSNPDAVIVICHHYKGVPCVSYLDGHCDKMLICLEEALKLLPEVLVTKIPVEEWPAFVRSVRH